MARPLRIHIENGWYHVTCRGTDRRIIFTEDRERKHFLELLEQLTERYRLIIHSYVLMANHYHLIVQTPEANLSAGMHWLNTSYSMWFNKRHDRVGPLLQGRYKGVWIEDGGWAYEASIYLHLNPVRTKSHGLDKRIRMQAREGLLEKPPSGEEVTARLQGDSGSNHNIEDNACNPLRNPAEMIHAKAFKSGISGSGLSRHGAGQRQAEDFR